VERSGSVDAGRPSPRRSAPGAPLAPFAGDRDARRRTAALWHSLCPRRVLSFRRWRRRSALFHCPCSSSPCLLWMLTGIERNGRGRRRRTLPAARGQPVRSLSLFLLICLWGFDFRIFTGRDELGFPFDLFSTEKISRT
jgi:hypothetical protein